MPDRSRSKGRGALGNPDSRFDALGREAFDDGWGDPEVASPATEIIADSTRTIIVKNNSPDIPFTQSINPYRGCEHGCIYCFARPSHEYLGFSAGLDFETKIIAKHDAPLLLAETLDAPHYQCEPLALGTNTDPYQPVERRLKIMRGILEVVAERHHPVSIVTKSALVERDLDILAPMAEKGLVEIFVSITTLDPALATRLEPRAASPRRRLRVLETLSACGIPVGVMAAPVIPALTDPELESILERAYMAGARRAGYVLLRLPREVKNLFKEWLSTHYPDKAEHVMSLVRQSRGGKENDAAFGRRMSGSGPFADMISQRFRLALKRTGYPRDVPRLDSSRFRPRPKIEQFSLF